MFKIKYVILLFLFFGFMPITFANEVAFIDVDYLFSNSKKGKEIITILNNLNENNQNILKKKENEIIDLKNQIENQQNLLKKDELNNKIEVLNLKAKDFNDLKKNLINEFEEKKNNEIKIFFNEINPLLEKYMMDNSIKIILDKKNIFLANKEYDITPEIIRIIDKSF